MKDCIKFEAEGVQPLSKQSASYALKCICFETYLHKKKYIYILIVALEEKSRGRLDTMIHALDGLCTAQELF